jgi:hypothetical protein
MQVDDWEVAVMRRTQHGESCRVTWVEGDLAALTEAFRMTILPDLERTRGFCCASLLVNPVSRLACATTAWQTRAAMDESRAASDDMHSRSAREAGGAIVQQHEFDLAYAHLHIPEMA